MTQSSFEITELALPGVLLIKPKRLEDERGFFMETFRQEVLEEIGIKEPFVQENLSYSKKGVLRGMHFQKQPHAQAKLVRCASGEIFDVVADHNPESPTFGKYISEILTGEQQNMLYIPGKYIHGFCVLSDAAVVDYKVTNYYSASHVSGVMYNDPIFNIQWPVSEPILSKQDLGWELICRNK